MRPFFSNDKQWYITRHFTVFHFILKEDLKPVFPQHFTRQLPYMCCNLTAGGKKMLLSGNCTRIQDFQTSCWVCLLFSLTGWRKSNASHAGHCTCLEVANRSDMLLWWKRLQLWSLSWVMQGSSSAGRIRVEPVSGSATDVDVLHIVQSSEWKDHFVPMKRPWHFARSLPLT